MPSALSAQEVALVDNQARETRLPAMTEAGEEIEKVTVGTGKVVTGAYISKLIRLLGPLAVTA